MGIRITSNPTLEHNLQRAQKDAENSLERLTSGVKFTRQDPMPADRAISDSISKRLREYNSYKRNANDGISVMQSADSSLNEVSNILVRMRELTAQAANPTVSDKERRYLMVEYEGLYDEVSRIAATANYNGLLLLAGEDAENSVTELNFRIGSSTSMDPDEDLNLVKLRNMDTVDATTRNLELTSIRELLQEEEGITLEDLEDTFDSDLNDIGTTFDAAFDKIAGFRASFGAVTSRLNRALSMIDVAQENMAAAQSKLKDVDYATEIANLTRANILVQAGAGLMSQANIPQQVALQLIRLID